MISPALLLLTAVFSLPASSDSQPSRAESPTQTRPWPVLCEEFKEHYPTKDGHAVYSDKPPRNPTPAWWLLRWEGINVPVPATTYEHVFIVGRVDGVVELMLVGEEARVALLRSVMDEPIEDYFQTIDLSNPGAGRTTTPEGRAFTRRIFGRTVSTAELILAAHEYRLEDLTCKAENQSREATAVYGFPLVDTIGTDETSAIYRTVGRRTGWISEGPAEEAGYRIWRAFTVGNSTEKGLHIELHLRDEPRFLNIGLEIAQSDMDETDKPSPDWLPALQAALAADTPAGWRALAVSLEPNGLSAKSVESIERFIEDEKQE